MQITEPPARKVTTYYETKISLKKTLYKNLFA